VGTQNQTDTLATAARVSGLPPERIEVVTPYLGGGFGRRLATDMVAEAVAIARAIDGPVQLVHRREHDFQAGLFRPGCHSLLRGAVGEDGAILAWWHKVATQPLAGPGGERPGVDRAAIAGVVDMPYATRALEVRWSPVSLPIPVWPWRSVGASHNAFVVESFVDELAHLAGADPLAYRLSLLQDNEVALNVLRLVAERSGYRPRPPGGGWGQGIAYHYSFGSHCAQVIDVAVHDGQPKVERVVVALDCGPVVNPDLVASQVEGAVVMGLSAAMKEAIHFSEGGVQSINLHQYDLLRCDEVPRIEVHLANGMREVGGVGEPALPPVAPALANGYFVATGHRVRRLPLLAALAPPAQQRATPAAS
jgi:isoquinoline 1-oxidoreductase beta subunit